MDVLGFISVIVVAVVLGAVMPQLFPRSYTRPAKKRTAQDDDLDALYRDLTGTYTAAELKAFEQQDRETHNRAAREFTAWNLGDESYMDYDGNWIRR